MTYFAIQISEIMQKYNWTLIERRVLFITSIVQEDVGRIFFKT